MSTSWLEEALGWLDDTRPMVTGQDSPREMAQFVCQGSVRYLGDYVDKDGDRCFAYSSDGRYELFTVYVRFDQYQSWYVPDDEYPIPDRLLRRAR